LKEKCEWQDLTYSSLSAGVCVNDDKSNSIMLLYSKYLKIIYKVKHDCKHQMLNIVKLMQHIFQYVIRLQNELMVHKLYTHYSCLYSKVLIYFIYMIIMTIIISITYNIRNSWRPWKWLFEITCSRFPRSDLNIKNLLLFWSFISLFFSMSHELLIQMTINQDLQVS
jgi:hypothetical protein